MSRHFACVPAAVLLAACTGFAGSGLKPGVSTEAEVVGALGKPAATYAEPGGGRALAYPTGPAGTQTYMARLAPDGRLALFEQVLTADQFGRLERGRTTSGELERLVGPPWRKTDFPNKGQVAWEYVFQDTWGYLVDFAVMVDGRGIVMETAYVRRDFGRDGGLAR